MMSNYDQTEQEHKALVVNTIGHSQRHDKLHNENRLLYNTLDTPCKAV